MALDLPHEVRDPIHGLIRLTEQEMGLVNTRAFQRLRRIRQLAMADLVYPGAVHTRFEHSLGTLHTAQRIIDHLKRFEGVPEEDERVVRLAALLHDIGHGPFSHVTEHLLDKYYDKAAVGESSAMEKIHEMVTVDVINKVDEVASLLSDDDRETITKIIAGERRRDYRRDIVSSDLDADKMDYLLRDAHYAGVRYGYFDLDKIIDVCRKYSRGEESYLIVREEGIFAVEQLVLAKHYMTHQVYAHRVRTVTDLMIVRGLELAIQDGHDDIRNLFSYNGSEDFLNFYLRFDDNCLMLAVMNEEYPRASKVFMRLHQRKLYKEVVAIRLNELDVDDSITRGNLLNLSLADLSCIEHRVAELMDCEPWEVIVHKKSIKHPAYQTTGGLEPEAIHILSSDGTSKAMSEFPDLISPRMPQTERLHVIAPISTNSQASRQTRQIDADGLGEKIKSLIFAYVGGAQ